MRRMQNFIILEILDLAHSVLISYSKQNHLQFFMSLSKYKHQDLASILVLELEMSFPKKFSIVCSCNNIVLHLSYCLNSLNKLMEVAETFSSIFLTLGAEMFGMGDFWLEIRVIIKISSHP